MSYKLIRVDPDTVVLDARGLGLTASTVAEVINEDLGFFQSLGTQLETRKPGEGLVIGTGGGPQAHIACMRSINAEIFVGSRKYLVPNQTRALVRTHVKL